MNPAPRPNSAALGYLAGTCLFTLAWLVLGWVSPGFTVFGVRNAPYSSIVHPVSGLGMGVTAPWMNGAFILMGLLFLLGAAGVHQALVGVRPARRWSSTLLLACSGVGGVLVGLFDLESFLLHTVGFVLACGMPVVSFAVTGAVLRRKPGWNRLARWLVIASPLTLVLLITFLATFDYQEAAAGRGVAGVTQRVLILHVQGTFVALGWAAYRRSPVGTP